MYPIDMSDEPWQALTGMNRRGCRSAQRPGHDQRHFLRTSHWLPIARPAQGHPPGNRSATPSFTDARAACGMRCWPWWRLQLAFRTGQEPGLCWRGRFCTLSASRHLCRWRHGQSDRLSAGHVWLKHAGVQALPATRPQGTTQA